MEADIYNGNGRATLASLSTRVDNLQDNISNVYAKLDAIGTKLDLATRPNWSVLIVGLGIFISMILGITTLVFQPLSGRIEENRLDSFSERSRIIQEFKEGRQALNERDERIRASIVSRSEQEQVWTAIRRQIDVLTTRMEETKQQLAQLYGPGDKLKDVQKQLDDLRDLVSRPNSARPLTNQ